MGEGGVRLPPAPRPRYCDICGRSLERRRIRDTYDSDTGERDGVVLRVYCPSGKTWLARFWGSEHYAAITVEWEKQEALHG